MAAEIVIAAYRPHAGKAQELDALVARHEAALRAAGLVTERPFVRMRAPSDGTVLEIFEWLGPDASSRAHDDPAVGALWHAMGEVADFPPLAEVPEAARRWAHFRPA